MAESVSGPENLALLTPTQQHYLKRALLKLQIEVETGKFNQKESLRRFGYPFSPNDPNLLKKNDKIEIPNGRPDLSEEYPLTKFAFYNFILTMPFLSEDHQNWNEFWVRRVQACYERFMVMDISDSSDRDEVTKRKKMGHKLNSLLLMVYNAGIGTQDELEYYNKAKSEIGDKTTSARIENLLFPTKETLQAHLALGDFVNGISLNVAGVRKVEKLNNRFLSSLNLKKSHETHFEFLIQAKLNLEESEEVYVSRRYSDFKDLHHKLKKKFPGKNIPSLPGKINSEISLTDKDEYDEEWEDDESDYEKEEEVRAQQDEIKKTLASLMQDLHLNDENPGTPELDSPESFADSPKKNKAALFLKSPVKKSSKLDKPIRKSQDAQTKLPREKTRTALRGYLRNLLKDVEISQCDILKEFLFKDKILKLTNDELTDIKIRDKLDLLLLMNEIKFQKETYKKIAVLKKESLPLRAKLLKSDEGIIEIFDEFKAKKHINELSPMLKNFIEWSKIELAATIYQLFLGTDNSYELYSQVRRLHKLTPYSVMYQILRFTNPMLIMKGMIELLMAHPFGGKSLLQTLFYGILSDDIKHQSKTIVELEAKINNESLIARLKYCVFDDKDPEIMESVRDESQQLKIEYLLMLIITPKIDDPDYFIDDETIGLVYESYNEHKKLQEIHDGDAKELIFLDHDRLELYSNLKQLHKLYIKKNDKEVLQQLWSEPELTSVLKECFTMFYQPLVSLFRNSHVEIAFKHYEHFMDDLILAIDDLLNEIYTKDTNYIIDKIMKVISKHEDGFYTFLHDVYRNDKDMIFQKMIDWINGILKFLRNSKKLNDLKTKRIDFNEIIKSTDVDLKELQTEVEILIENTRKHREKYNAKLEKSIEKKDLINDNWKVINNVEIFQAQDFGINENDLIDINDETGGDDEEKEKINTKNHEIKKVFAVFQKQLLAVLESYNP